MARNTEAIYTSYSLPKGSDALQDLDDFCHEWGDISRADATQRIIIAWAKARHGDLSACGAMGITLAITATPSTSPIDSGMPSGALEARMHPTVKRPFNGNAKAVELDL